MRLSSDYRFPGDAYIVAPASAFYGDLPISQLWKFVAAVFAKGNSQLQTIKWCLFKFLLTTPLHLQFLYATPPPVLSVARILRLPLPTNLWSTWNWYAAEPTPGGIIDTESYALLTYIEKFKLTFLFLYVFIYPPNSQYIIC